MFLISGTTTLNLLLFAFICVHLRSLFLLTLVFANTAIAGQAAIATAHPLATAIGLDVIKKGGNAVDASIAVQFALSVCYPNAGNIGGGGFMIYRSADGKIDALDYREKAPAKASSDMYLDSLGNPIESLSKFGHLAAGVPGTVDGMVKAFEKYSKLKDWKKLLQPAIDMAKNGYKITDREANNLNEEQTNFVKYNYLNTSKFKLEA